MRSLVSIRLLIIVAAVVGATGCAPLRAPEPVAHDTDRDKPYLVLRLGERRLYLHDGDGTPQSFLVAIGKKPWETPTGRFQILEMIQNPDFLKVNWNDPSHTGGTIPPGPTNPLGLRWIGFTHAYGWTIGFHGTQNVALLGQAVSHGCVRMSNADVVRLYSA